MATNLESGAGDGRKEIPSATGGLTRREVVRGVALIAAAEKLTDGGLAQVSFPARRARAVPVLPPLAVSPEAFARKCVGCQKCVASCPGECLRPSVALRNFGQIEMDFRRGHCLVDCDFRCARACPAGAISLAAAAGRVTRRNVRNGVAVWEASRCIRRTDGVACTACQRKCPVGAIHLIAPKDAPAVISVDDGLCIGCGACEHVCPSRPETAIFVRGRERQQIVRPLEAEDLWAEMRSRLDSGAAVVAARNGVIVACESGGGIAPLLRLLDTRRLGDGTLVCDRVIGRAAAAICIVGGVREVRALVAGADAVALLSRHGITCVAEKTVPQILNRDRSDACPMETRVAGCDDPAEMVERLRK